MKPHDKPAVGGHDLDGGLRGGLFEYRVRPPHAAEEVTSRA